MKLVPVEFIPEKGVKTKQTSVSSILEDFVHGPDNLVRVDIDNYYSCTESAVKGIRQCVTRNRFPVKIIMRGDNIYLAKEKNDAT